MNAQNIGATPLKKSPSLGYAEALELLKEGNRRFEKNIKLNRDLLSQVNQTCQGQWPFAAILSCMDSRTPAELIFDLGIGDVFSIRVAGHVISPNILGSLEYAAAVVKTPLIVVLGHSHCGAVRGACDGVELGHLTPMLRDIQPAIDQETTVREHRCGDNPDFVRKVSQLHAINTLETILERSPILRDLAVKGALGLVPALYDLDCGRVSFFMEYARFGLAAASEESASAQSA